jgi:hypothetical protein
MIAIGLLSVLITAIFTFWQYTISFQNEVDKMRRNNFRFLTVQQRLERVFSHIQGGENKQKPVFFTSKDQEVSGQGLVFVFDNDVDGQYQFANNVLGRLYVDHQGRLSLVIWPTLERFSGPHAPMRKEILLEGVRDISFEMYRPKDVNAKDVKVARDEEKLLAKWETDWPRTEESLPVMIKIFVTLNNENHDVITFAFMIPEAKQKIVYSN